MSDLKITRPSGKVKRVKVPTMWWDGDARVSPFMGPLSDELKRFGVEGDAKMQIYNRAYEAVYSAILKYDKN